MSWISFLVSQCFFDTCFFLKRGGSHFAFCFAPIGFSPAARLSTPPLSPVPAIPLLIFRAIVATIPPATFDSSLASL